jgi:eukaryotic-like serine/threonine-protein kinase
MTTSPDRWQTVERLYHATLAQPVERRAAFLTEACAGDEELRHEVESLLAQDGSTDGVLTRGAAVAAAGLVSDIGQSVLTGRRFGAYQILAPLGVGGMGEVYRARDTRLGRHVAIKILPAAFTSHPNRLARFEREARVLASLNHPHIGAIYGVEDQPADPGAGFSRPVHGLVLELVEGHTLADRIAGGPLRVDDALAIARQIADALDAAHEKGIIHRDLKPANIKITPEGVVKVLDFGLAKLEVLPNTEGGTASPTITVGDTREGLIVGTAAYMSPEQARGQAVDKRTDIWAFGCVVYEMVTGRAPFARDTTSDTLAAILEREPDWRLLPTGLPAAAGMLIRDCLNKDPKRRLRDIGDAHRHLATDPLAAVSRSRRAGTLSAVAALFLVVVGLSAGAWRWLRTSPVPATPTEFSFAAPPDTMLDPTFPVPSPDGTRIAFVVRVDQGPSTVWVRRLDSSASRQIAGTEGATGPSWSPDGRFIAFQSGGKLKKVDAGGGPVLTIASMGTNLGSTWNADNVIVFAPSNRTPLYRVSADGGSTEPITALDRSHGENSHRWPVFLPDGRHFLFTARSDVKENTAIYVGSLDSKTATRLVTAQSNAVYVPPGYLLFAREGTVIAQKFDIDALNVFGEAFALAPGVDHITASAQALFAVSANGNVLAYQEAAGRDSRLTWFDQDGKNAGSIGPEKDFTTDVEISPNGKQAVVVIPDPDSGNRDLWLVDLRTGGLTRLTTHPANDWQPAWEPDSTHVAFTSDRNGMTGVYRKAVNGSGEEELIDHAFRIGDPKDFSPDGRFLLFARGTSSGATDLWVAPRIGGGMPYPFVVSPFVENQAAFSPDGRWVIYESDESGADEIYLKPFAGAGKQQVSRGGGHSARWNRDGTEIYYLSPSNQLMRVAVRGGEAIETSTPMVLFTPCKPGDPNPLYVGRWYDVAPDGRFLMPCSTARQVPTITVMVGWKVPSETAK